MTHVLSAADVIRGKPDPEGYFLSVHRALAWWAKQGVSSDDVVHVAVEKSPTGLRAALAAGIPCVHEVLAGKQPFAPWEVPRIEVAYSSDELLAAIRRAALR